MTNQQIKRYQKSVVNLGRLYACTLRANIEYVEWLVQQSLNIRRGTNVQQSKKLLLTLEFQLRREWETDQWQVENNFVPRYQF